MADIPRTNGNGNKTNSIFLILKDIILIGSLITMLGFFYSIKADVEVLKALLREKTAYIEKDVTRLQTEVNIIKNK